ncbi:DUF4365 domain-containing protein [Chryseobacterium sp. RP-3-3]|uniref:DUF4365 domain-containing protein n=1 Tax=Chryseobacterium antibioticum TaxID=2728847 RepID=A0A7Y0AQS0_9FLAO|nr:DUF4365 domain-containing protein [Chryseobacterium antibioticum]NML71687.1 DUF4365 domain-containing protein [Chryseobacterium antibioticum]
MSSKLDNTEIEDKANSLLNDTLSELFRSKNFKMIKHESGRREIGIDFFYQIVDREESVDEFIFLNQNKGKNAVVKSKKNADVISYPLTSLRHPISWYNKISEPFVFTLCDIVSNKIYYYFIQNDDTILNRIREQKNKKVKSFQIYIPKDNILNEENFDKFLDEISTAKIKQIEKLHGNLFESHKSDYSIFKKETEGLHTIDKLNYIIEKFECIKVIPKNILSEILYHTFGENTYLNDMSISTNNEEFYNTIKDFDVNRRRKTYKILSGHTFVDKQEEKIKSIVSFFRINAIEHIYFRGRILKEGNRFCIHNLFLSGTCNCERCTFERLDIRKTENLLKLNRPEYSSYEKLRKAYTSFLFGNVEQSIDIYRNENKNKNPITYLIAKLNLLELKQLSESSFYFDDEIKKKFKDIDDKSEEKFILDKAQHFLDIYKTLKDFRFVYRNIVYIDNLLFELQKTWLRDRKGGWTSNTQLLELQSNFLRIHNFFKFNFVLLNQYNEYEQLCRKILEGILIIYTLRNPDYEKYEFDFKILEMWMFYVKSEDAAFLLNKYEIKSIKIQSSNLILGQFKIYIDNLIKSVNNLKRNKDKYRLVQKISNIIQNIVIIISKVEIDKESLNILFSKLLKFIKINKIERLSLVSDLMKVVSEKEDIISKENLFELIKLGVDDNVRISNFSFLAKLYFEKATSEEIIDIIKGINDVSNIEDIDFSKKDNYFKYWYGLSFLDDELQNTIKQKVCKELENNFNSELYSTAVVLDTIVPRLGDQLLEKFIEGIPNLSKERDAFGSPENYRLDQAINIFFKLGFSLKKLEKYIDYNVSSKKNYYDWLVHLDTFDYSKFNPYWLIGNNLKYYINTFKKSKPLLDYLKEYLKSDYDNEIGKFYLENLVD